MKKNGTLDLRIKRTQTAIKKSFLSLVESKGFEHISVKDITDGAMISRNTFYLHYSDKYELLNKICDEMMRTMFFRVGKQLRRVQQGEITVESVATIISHATYVVQADKEQYRVLFNTSSDILTEKLSLVIRSFIDLFLEKRNRIDDFSNQYIISGLTGLIRYTALNEVEDVEAQSHGFVEMHLGRIIDFINEKKNEKE